MRILKPLIIASAVVASGSAFAQGRSSEAEMSQGIRNSNLAFTQQTQNRGFFAVPGFFAPGLTNGYIGERRAYPRRTARGAPLYNVPGTVDWSASPRAYYNEPMGYRSRGYR